MNIYIQHHSLIQLYQSVHWKCPEQLTSATRNQISLVVLFSESHQLKSVVSQCFFQSMHMFNLQKGETRKRNSVFPWCCSAEMRRWPGWQLRQSSLPCSRSSYPPETALPHQVRTWCRLCTPVCSPPYPRLPPSSGSPCMFLVRLIFAPCQGSDDKPQVLFSALSCKLCYFPWAYVCMLGVKLTHFDLVHYADF